MTKHKNRHDIATETNCMKVYEEVINFVYFNVDMIGWFWIKHASLKII